MAQSPRTRRLRTDRKVLTELRSESTILDFDVNDVRSESYTVRFFGKGLWRCDGSGEVLIRDRHEVKIDLGAGYPRSLPGLSWITPIFHPNISAGGVVCLGGYGTHWVPSLNLGELCEMLWDMIRYRNFDVESPYNREAALWAKSQHTHQLPIDPRPIRDRVATPQNDTTQSASTVQAGPPTTDPSDVSDIIIIDQEGVIDAEIVDYQDQDIVFLD